MLAHPDRPDVLGHRGASAHAPENTEEAFRLAAAQGADGVELDVRRTADGVLMVHHDAAPPGAEPIVELTAAELRQRHPAIPTLDEALAACGGMWVNIEIKNAPADPDFDPADRVAQDVARLIDRARLHDRIIVSSFNVATVDAVRAADRRIRTGVLLGPGSDPGRAATEAATRSHQAIHPFGGDLAGDRAGSTVAAATGAGLWVIVWTVDDPTEIVRLAGAGVHGIITNDPAGARQVLATAQ